MKKSSKKNNSIRAAANALLECYSQMGYQLQKHLEKGIAEKELRLQYDAFRSSVHPLAQDDYPRSLPTALVDLYAWKNGTKLSQQLQFGEICLIPGYYLMKFEEALVAWEVVSEAIEDSSAYENDNVQFQGTSMFPFLSDSMGNHIVMNVEMDSPSVGSIGQFHVDGVASCLHEFATLDVFFVAHLQCCKSIAYFINENGFLDSNLEKATYVLAPFRTASA